MNVELFIPFLICFILFLSVKFSNYVIKLDIENVKYPEIDGIRGYLGLFVFLHHSYIWKLYLKNNLWEHPKSNLFNHFGETSVVLFFMITSFLFVSKIIKFKGKEYNWNKYIISRFYRLFPMYIFTICVVFTIVLYLTNFELKDSLLNIIKSICSWIFFSINGSVDINLLDKTFLINSGVAWTLPYEWMFYLLLPIIALFFKVKVPIKTLLLFTFIFLVLLYINQSSLKNFIPFLGGIICALMLNNSKIKVNWKDYKFSILGLVFLFLSVYYFNSGKKILPIIASTYILFIISNGNSFFGLLSSSFSRKLGQITYSIYLIHGLVLFLVFRFVIGLQKAAELSELEYWGVISLCIFPVIFLSQITFKNIELYFINYNKRNS